MQHVIFFKKKDGKFSGIIKVDFGDQNTLQEVIKDKITILQQRYLVDEFIRKSRAVKCNKCQGWGHVHRYCKNEAKCGKCGDKHETNTCNVTVFKCCHCSGPHRAGSSECQVFKDKMDQFNIYNQNG